MGYRGRLVWPVQARIERLDTVATKANAIGSQPSGFDRTFREPVTRASDGKDSRVYMSEVAVSCQVIPDRGEYDSLKQRPGGRELEFDLRIGLHYADMEAAGFIETDGGVVFKPSDRLLKLYKPDSTTLLRDFTANVLYCFHVQDRSFGLDDLNRNLVLLYFRERTAGAP